jgi:hypothetical protein
MITLLLLFIAFTAIISGFICLVKASGLIYNNEEERRNNLTIIGVILFSFGMAFLLWILIKL